MGLPKHFSLYRNCRSIFIFKKRGNNYKIVNKVKDWSDHFVVNYRCTIKTSQLNNFLKGMVYYDNRSLARLEPFYINELRLNALMS